MCNRQQYHNERLSFTLEPKHIRLNVKNLDGEKEVFVDYETLTPTIRTLTQQDGRL
jgi:hypothetical protein